MHKYNGRVVHQSHDDDGILEIVELDGIRSLHFGSDSRQSSMLLTNPDKLILGYVRAMTSWLLFKQPLNDDEVLTIGLGGGSLTRHLLHHFPDCRIKAIEPRKSVIKIARSYFDLPRDPRLKIIIGDGGQYVRLRAETFHEQYSLLLIDAFDHDGMAQSLCSEAFFDACKILLKKDGILVINLWGGTNNPLFQTCALWIGRIFNWKILFLPVQGRGNIICLAFNENFPLFPMKYLRTRAIALEQKYQIEFPVFLKDIKKHNASTFSEVIKL
ncbi:MAG: spermine synthase [Methylobacter sp.]|nr:spermine synthase [Methylobacter sp.]